MDSGFKKVWYFVCVAGCTYSGVGIHQNIGDGNFKVTVYHCQAVLSAVIVCFIKFVTQHAIHVLCHTAS